MAWIVPGKRAAAALDLLRYDSARTRTPTAAAERSVNASSVAAAPAVGEPALAVGAGLGSYAASGVAVDLPEAQLRVAFAAFIAGLGMHALRGALKMPKV